MQVYNKLLFALIFFGVNPSIARSQDSLLDRIKVSDDLISHIDKNRINHEMSVLSLSDSYGLTEDIYSGDIDGIKNIEKGRISQYENALAKVSIYRIQGKYAQADVDLRAGIDYLSSAKEVDVSNLSYLTVMYAGNLFMEGKTKDWIDVRNYIQKNIKEKLTKTSGVRVKYQDFDDISLLKNVEPVRNMSVDFGKSIGIISLFYNSSSPDVPMSHIEVSGIVEPAKIDTGALLTVIPESLATRLNLQKIGNIERAPTLAGISVRGYLAVLDKMKLGDVTFRDVPVAVMKSDNIIIGNMILYTMGEIVMHKNRMEYGRNIMNCTKEMMLPSRIGGYERNIIYDIKLNGDKKRSSIDTGMSASTLVHYQDSFNREEQRASSQVTASGVFGIDYVKAYKTLSKVNYGTFQVSDEDTMVILQKGHLFDTIVSGKILNNSSIYLNFVDGKICLQPD